MEAYHHFSILPQDFPSRAQIIIVDDDPDVLQIIISTLRGMYDLM
jgi:hypothetical protein